MQVNVYCSMQVTSFWGCHCSPASYAKFRLSPLPLIAIMWHRQFHSLSCHKWKLSQRYRLRFVCTIVQDNRRREKALVYLVDTLSRTEHTIPCPKRQKTKAFVFMPRYTWLISIDATGILHNIEENEKQYLLFFPFFYSLFSRPICSMHLLMTMLSRLFLSLFEGFYDPPPGV